MVNGRRPPPPSPSGLAEPTSRAKDYSGRPTEVTSELDELRNRGIAKGLNRHFTDTTKRLAKEKAAADAAIADLERRRANKSEFVPSRGGELNPFDSLYVELQQKRAECRRKEKETMLLYQRYVHKYGKKAKLSAPTKEDISSKNAEKSSKKNMPPQAIAETGPLSALATQDDSLQAKAVSSAAVPSQKSPSQAPPAKVLLQPLDENSESAVDEDINFSRFYNKQLSFRGRDTPADPPADPPGMLVTPDPPEKNNVDDSDLPPEVPTLEELTAQVSHDTDTMPSKHEEENTAADASKKSTGNRSSKPDPEESGAFDGNRSRRSESSDESETRPTALVTTEMPSATTATDDDESDDRSVISGLTTANSVYTRQVMDEIEMEMEDFLKTETLAIQKMMESEEKSIRGSVYHGSVAGSSSVFGDESVRVAMKAEAMAREMQKILDDFQKDDKSISGHGDLDSEDAQHEDEDFSAATTLSNYPRKYNVSIPGEEWLVYFDENNQREYFYEKNSNRTQWHAPTQSRTNANEAEAEAQDYRSQRRTTRKEQYRKRLRKRRIRRLAASSFVAICGMATYYHWQTNHAEKTYPEAMKATLHDIQNYDFVGAIESVKDQFEYTFTDRRIREETQKEKEKRERLEKEAKAREEEERKAREKAEREEKKRQEKLLAEQKAREETERKAAEQKAREEELRREREEAEKRAMAEREEAERRAIAEREEAEKRALAEREEAERREAAEQEQKERLAMTQPEDVRRPWGCKIPFANVVRKRCRKPTKPKPKFDEKAILDSFVL